MITQYEFLETLSQGSDTIIYKALDLNSKSNVFIKAFQTEAIRSWKRFELIQREEDILAQLNHPRIPKLNHTFAHEKALFLVTEWIEGQNLAQKTDLGWAPTEAEILSIAEQTLEILMYIHHFNPPIVHRDLKPSNLMINPEGELFLIDFGGALKRIYGEGDSHSTMVIGKSGYIAPEEFLGQASVSTDLYSLGACLLYLLTGIEPETLLNASTPHYWKKHCENIDPDIILWLEKMVARHQQERYKNAAHALVALDQTQGKDPLARKIKQPRKLMNHDFKRQLNSVLFEEEQALPQGTILSEHYEINGSLGQGNQSHVYLGTDKRNCKNVILKELKIAGIDTVKTLELFERETQLLQKISHPFIPQFIDCFKTEKENEINLYLVSEAIEGNSLSQLLEKGWRPSGQQIWQIAADLLKILIYLHQSSPPLVHRDIKPSNILLGENEKAYLIDFGAAQSRQISTGAGGSTIVFSMGYTAPEQFGGQATPASDLYSLGATLIHLLSGLSPNDLKMGELGLNFKHRVHCGEFHIKWLNRLVQTNADKRFNNAQIALEALKKYNALLDTSISSPRGTLEPPINYPDLLEKHNLIFNRHKGNMHVISLKLLPPLYQTLFSDYYEAHPSYDFRENPPFKESIANHIIQRNHNIWMNKLSNSQTNLSKKFGLTKKQVLQGLAQLWPSPIKSSLMNEYERILTLFCMVISPLSLWVFIMALSDLSLTDILLSSHINNLSIMSFILFSALPLGYLLYQVSRNFKEGIDPYQNLSLEKNLREIWISEFHEVADFNQVRLNQAPFLKEIRVSHKHLSCFSPQDDLAIYELSKIDDISIHALRIPDHWHDFLIREYDFELVSLKIVAKHEVKNHLWVLNTDDMTLLDGYFKDLLTEVRHQIK